MLIDLNTKELQDSVQMARQTNQLLNEVAALLNSIVVHNDWQCPERTQMNENTSRNRAQAMTLQMDAESFYKATLAAAQSFEEAERDICRSMDAVESSIGSYLSDAASGNTPASSSGHSVKNVIDSLHRDGIAKVFQDWKEKVNIVDFGKIRDAFNPLKNILKK